MIYHFFYSGKDLSTLSVKCGDWDIKREIEAIAAQERRVAEVRIHPEFPRNPNERGTDLDDRTRARNQDNIAILIMKENFDLTPQVNKICLPTSANRLKRKMNEWLFSTIFQILGPLSEKTQNPC